MANADEATGLLYTDQALEAPEGPASMTGRLPQSNAHPDYLHHGHNHEYDRHHSQPGPSNGHHSSGHSHDQSSHQENDNRSRATQQTVVKEWHCCKCTWRCNTLDLNLVCCGTDCNHQRCRFCAVYVFSTAAW